MPEGQEALELMPTKDPREPFSRITVQEAQEMLGRDDVVVIDVREPHEYAGGHVPDAKLIPVNSVYARREELPRDKDIHFYGRSGGIVPSTVEINEKVKEILS